VNTSGQLLQSSVNERSRISGAYRRGEPASRGEQGAGAKRRLALQSSNAGLSRARAGCCCSIEAAGGRGVSVGVVHFSLVRKEGVRMG
jgi:hypothetical protein